MQVDLATSVQSRMLASGTSAPADTVDSQEELLLQLLPQVRLLNVHSESLQSCHLDFHQSVVCSWKILFPDQDNLSCTVLGTLKQA